MSKFLQITKFQFFTLTLLSFLGGIVFTYGFLRIHETSSLEGNIAPEVGISEEEEGIDLKSFDLEVLVEMVQFREYGRIEQYMSEFTEKDAFLSDLRNCVILQDVHTTELSEGFWLSFQCTKEGDSLHPYFGYFQLVDQRRVYWSSIPKVRIESRETKDGKKFLVLKNISDIPFSLGDGWEDSVGNTVKTKSPNGEDEIKAGEIAVFETSEFDEDEYYRNSIHEYFLDVR